MTNYEKNGFVKYPLCNKHVHPTEKRPIEDTVRCLERLMSHFGFDKIALMSLTRDSKKRADISNNLKSLYLKSVFNKSCPDSFFAYGNIYHYYDEKDTSEGYLNQAKKMYQMGVDGYKFLDGKPELRMYLKKALDDEIFDKMYAFMEEKNMPVTYHLGDPPEFWDREKIPQWALDRGWFWGDGKHTSLETLRCEIEGILKKFPRLKVCIAHFYFLSHDIEYATRLMETFENVSLDITPGSEMFAGFSKNIEKWRDFFQKYSKRIYLGTDSYNQNHGDDDEYDFRMGYATTLIRNSMEKDAPFDDRRLGVLNPVNPGKDAVDDIYRGNFVSLHPKSREIDYSLCIKEAEKCIDIITNGKDIYFGEDFDKDMETDNLNEMIKHFDLMCK